MPNKHIRYQYSNILDQYSFESWDRIEDILENYSGNAARAAPHLFESCEDDQMVFELFQSMIWEAETDEEKIALINMALNNYVGAIHPDYGVIAKARGINVNPTDGQEMLLSGLGYIFVLDGDILGDNIMGDGQILANPKIISIKQVK